VSGVHRPGVTVPASGRYTFVNVWGTECGWILLRKGEHFPAICPHREYRFFANPQERVAPVIRLAA